MVVDFNYCDFSYRHQHHHHHHCHHHAITSFFKSVSLRAIFYHTVTYDIEPDYRIQVIIWNYDWNFLINVEMNVTVGWFVVLALDGAEEVVGGSSKQK